MFQQELEQKAKDKRKELTMYISIGTAIALIIFTNLGGVDYIISLVESL